MTYGQKAVELTFNSSSYPRVRRINELYAEIIDLCNEQREAAGRGEQARLFSVAITEAQTAQMWAEKALNWQDL